MTSVPGAGCRYKHDEINLHDYLGLAADDLLFSIHKRTGFLFERPPDVLAELVN